MKNLTENLKNLPKYTLNEKQKEKITLSIRREINSRKRTQFVKPAIVFAFMCVTLFVLFLANENNSWVTEIKKSFQPQIELNAPAATVFKNHNDVIGIERKIGLLFNEQFVAEDARRGSKMMLYFWGDPLQLINQNYRVEAVNVYNEKIILSEGILATPLNNEDAHTLTRFPAFPTEGKWQLSFFVDDQLFEEFTIDVLPPFPKTKHFTLMDSPMEIAVGEEADLTIESPVEGGKEIEVKLLNHKGNIVSEHVFIQDGIFHDASGGSIYHYDGKMVFPDRGTWSLLINGEKTRSFKN